MKRRQMLNRQWEMVDRGKSLKLVEWKFETYLEKFLEPLQWTQSWTLCHERDWKKPLNMRFRLWDTCFAI